MQTVEDQIIGLLTKLSNSLQYKAELVRLDEANNRSAIEWLNAEQLFFRKALKVLGCPRERVRDFLRAMRIS